MVRPSIQAVSANRWWKPEPRILVDVFVAVVIAILAVADVVSTSADRLPGERAADGLAYVLVIAASAAVVWRRRTPILVLAIDTALLVVFWLRGHGALLSVIGLPVFYAVVVHTERRREAWWALALSFVALFAAASVSVLDTPGGFAYLRALSIVAFLTGAVIAGVIIRNRERIFVDTELRAAAAEADRLAEAERAVATERRRIAREMHDVVAHGMSVVAVQAAAGREIVHVNPDKAAEVFARIEAVGRDSLAELRRMLGVLRDGDDADASLTPQPKIADIAAAVEESSAAGVATSLVIEGRPRSVADGTELAAFRIVQEALTNVRKHAGTSAAATVRISYGSHSLRVEVTDDGRGAATSLAGSGTGHGLIGMRERVEIYGGDFTSGPKPGGGYVVQAILPLVGSDAECSASEAHEETAGA